MIKPLRIATLLLLGMGMFVTHHAAGEHVVSLRGHTPLDEDTLAPEQKQWDKDGLPIQRDYVQQPPLIPHQIEGYVITSYSIHYTKLYEISYESTARIDQSVRNTSCPRR